MYPWGNTRRFNSLSDLYRQRHGTRLQKLTVNAGFTCPNRDGSRGWGGCIFCNNAGFNPSYCDPSKSITRQIDEGLSFVRNRYPRAKRFVAYFQAFSNTYAQLEHLARVYEEALRHPAISGLVIGTRPDCVDEEKLDYLARLAERAFVKIEYGVESCYDETLQRINRGHSFDDTRRAIALTAQRGLFTGIHMIFGLPGESRRQMLDQVHIINDLPVHAIKLHQLQVVKGTALAREYQESPGSFNLFSPGSYVEFVVAFVERLAPGIAIDRFSGEVPPRLIAGNRWDGVRADAIIGRIEKKMEENDTWQGRLFGFA